MNIEKNQTPKNISKGFIAGLSIIGLSCMSYLLYMHYLALQSPICSFNDGVGCEVVSQSMYSLIFGIPIALLGFIYFLTVLIALFQNKWMHAKYCFIINISVFALIYSLSLSIVELFQLNSICIVCESAKIAMFGILGFALGGKIHAGETINKFRIATAVVIGLLFSWAVFVTQQGPIIEKDYDSFAECLTERNVSIYGAYWCPSCATQKRKFGTSFKYIDSIECDPRGENPQVSNCLDHNISVSPTWIREENDVELKRLEGVQSLEDLSKAFDCKIPESIK